MSVEPRKQKSVSALSRLIQTTMGDGRTVGGEPGTAKEKWPNLWEWLTVTEAGKDYLKQPATLKVTAAPEGFIGTLSDNDLCVSMDAPSATLEGIFDALEAALKSDAPPIRSWAKKQPQLRKRKRN